MTAAATRPLTGWLVDSLSADTFGRKARCTAGGEITKEQAEALRQTVLKSCAKASRPEISVGGDGQEYAATLYCDGPFADLDWRYYDDAAGYEAHEETGGGRVLVGLHCQHDRLCRRAPTTGSSTLAASWRPWTKATR